MPYGIILLPGDPDTERISAYSHRLGMAASASMLLGDDAPAHLSLAHFDCPQATARSCWDNFSAGSPASVPVELAGLAFKPLAPGDYYVPEGGVAVSLEARGTELLKKLHDRAVEIARDAGAVILGRPEFRPHVTLAVLRGTRVGEFEIMPDVVCSSFGGRVALGRLGPYGTFPTILAKK